MRVLCFCVFAVLLGCGGGGGGGGGGSSSTSQTTRPLPTSGAIDEAGGIPSNWALAWSDEFDQDGLPDAAKWDYDGFRNKEGWYNGEAQYYSRARLENSRVENGHLVIETRREELPGESDWGGQSYSSARLVTHGKASWIYGAVEVRAKLPCGRGTWPAIWMLPEKVGAQWPLDGEIDIMEHVGYDEGVVHGTIHTGAFNHTLSTQKAAQTRISDLCTNFHRYQLIWTADSITIGVDDHNYFRFVNDGSGDKTRWPFSQSQYLILNTAVGGSWGGAQGIDDTVFPVKMEVDYVRVWQAPK